MQLVSYSCKIQNIFPNLKRYTFRIFLLRCFATKLSQINILFKIIWHHLHDFIILLHILLKFMSNLLNHFIIGKIMYNLFSQRLDVDINYFIFPSWLLLKCLMDIEILHVINKFNGWFLIFQQLFATDMRTFFSIEWF